MVSQSLGAVFMLYILCPITLYASYHQYLDYYYYHYHIIIIIIIIVIIIITMIIVIIIINSNIISFCII